MSRYFTTEHEWIEVDGDSATVGITDYAQSQLGDIVFVEVPGAGTSVSKGGDAAVVESVKAASDVYSPVAGEVIEANGALADEPSLVNTDPEREGWFFKLRKAASDVYAPVSGTVTEGNAALEAEPALVNSDPEGDGWFFKLTLNNPTELDGLMDENAYQAWVNTL